MPSYELTFETRITAKVTVPARWVKQYREECDIPKTDPVDLSDIQMMLGDDLVAAFDEAIEVPARLKKPDFTIEFITQETELE